MTVILPQSTPKADAGSRLVMIPELLEKILHQVAQAEIEDEQDDPFLPTSPVKSLYRLLRVNKTFRDTITGSTLLKRAMWLRPSDVVLQSYEREWRHCTRVKWLLSEMKGGNEELEIRVHHWDTQESTTHLNFTIDCGSITIVDHDEMEEQVRAFREFVHKYGEDGSWREMGVQVCSENVTFFLEMVRHRQGLCRQWGYERQLSGSATLGAVFDTYRELIKPFENYLDAGACALAEETFFKELRQRG